MSRQIKPAGVISHRPGTDPAPLVCVGNFWRRMDSNHRPVRYERTELPLLYAAELFVAPVPAHCQGAQPCL
jgi:hypothetical protein